MRRQSTQLSVVGSMVRDIVEAIVDHIDDVEIIEVEGTRNSMITINTHPSDTGKVIGRDGVHADAIRKLATAAGGKLRRRYTIEIIEHRRRW